MSKIEIFTEPKMNEVTKCHCGFGNFSGRFQRVSLLHIISIRMSIFTWFYGNA